MIPARWVQGCEVVASDSIKSIDSIFIVSRCITSLVFVSENSRGCISIALTLIAWHLCSASFEIHRFLVESNIRVVIRCCTLMFVPNTITGDRGRGNHILYLLASPTYRPFWRTGDSHCCERLALDLYRGLHTSTCPGHHTSTCRHPDHAGVYHDCPLGHCPCDLCHDPDAPSDPGRRLFDGDHYHILHAAFRCHP